MYEQSIQGRHMRKYTHGKTAHENTDNNKTEVVTEHAHTDRNTCNTLTSWVKEGLEAVGLFKTFEKETIVCTASIVLQVPMQYSCMP